MLHALCDPVTAVSEWKSVGLLEKTWWKDMLALSRLSWMKENGSAPSLLDLLEQDSVDLEVGMQPLAASVKDCRACHRSTAILEGGGLQ